jgi:acyl carrier protein
MASQLRAQIKEFIVALLTKKAALPGAINTESALEAFRYLDYGQIDSLGLVKFIYEIEERFNIELSAEDTQSDQFRSVAGLIDLVTAKIGTTNQ